MRLLRDLGKAMVSMAACEQSACRWLAPEPRQVGLARDWVRKTLAGWGQIEHADVVELLASELTTNAIRYGDGEGRVELVLALAGADVWIEVRDGGEGRPTRRQASGQDTRGRGLELIEALLNVSSGVWGVQPHTSGVGKTVFAAVATR